MKLKKFSGNPILKSVKSHPWESEGVFNPAAIYENGKVYIIYRAMGEDGVSRLGLAISNDGLHIEKRLKRPIYVPREKFEVSINPYENSGCEDPRIVKIKDKFYLFYTAFNGIGQPGIALSTIKVKDFLSHDWNWEKPVFISFPGIRDKNTCIIPEKINGKYVIFHRFYTRNWDPSYIWIDYINDLTFKKRITGKHLIRTRSNRWDSKRIGIGVPPIKTKKGWLAIYSGVDWKTNKYRIGAMLLDLKRPERVIKRSNKPILEPTEKYEKGKKWDVAFPCGAAVIDGTIFVYYGGADKYVAVAYANLKDLLESF